MKGKIKNILNNFESIYDDSMILINICSILVAFFSFYVSSRLLKNKMANMKFYIIACLVFVIAYSISFLLQKSILRRIEGKNVNKTPRVLSVYNIFINIFALVLVYYCTIMNFHYEGVGYLYSESGAWIKYQMPILIFLIFIMIIAFIVFNFCIKKNNSSKLMRGAISFLYLLLVSFLFFSPNLFNGDFFHLYHAHAYDNSIYNILNYAPYDDFNRSIYGHYALFFFLPCKFLHAAFGINYVISVSFFIAFTAFVAFSSFAYILSILIKRDAVYYMALFMLGSFVQVLQYHNYFQGWPHRLFFPLLMLAYIAYENNKKSFRYDVIAYILVSLSILWNLETGIIVMLAVSFYKVFFFEQFYSLKKTVVKIIKYALFSIVAFFIAWGIVDFFNLVCGGKLLSLKEFIFPIASDVYKISNLQLQIPRFLQAWSLTTILFLSFGCFYFFNFAILRKVLCRNEIIKLIACVFGIGLSTYYMNRAAQGNLFICYPFAIIILSSFIDDVFEFQIEPYFNTKKTMNFFTVALFSVFLLVCSSQVFDNFAFPFAIQQRRTRDWDYKSFKQFAAEIDGQIPLDTFAFGFGVPELFAQMNRNPGIFMIDWSDITDGGGGMLRNCKVKL